MKHTVTVKSETTYGPKGGEHIAIAFIVFMFCLPVIAVVIHALTR